MSKQCCWHSGEGVALSMEKRAIQERASSASTNFICVEGSSDFPAQTPRAFCGRNHAADNVSPPSCGSLNARCDKLPFSTIQHIDSFCITHSINGVIAAWNEGRRDKVFSDNFEVLERLGGAIWTNSSSCPRFSLPCTTAPSIIPSQLEGSRRSVPAFCTPPVATGNGPAGHRTVQMVCACTLTV
jgi:hypothetical protein